MQKNSVESKSVRLDKWLWAARFYKTRSIARDAVQSGKVQYNEQRSKAGKIVELGANIKIPQLMYEETLSSETLRANNAEARRLSAFHSPKPDGRPDKKQRRQIIQFKHQ
jgi:ribosome-associated heat shock protein Hsp15